MRTPTMKERFTLQKYHKWFAHISRNAEDGWVGPARTIGAAVLLAMERFDAELPNKVYVCQGHKLMKFEIEEMGVDYTHEVKSGQCFCVIINPEKEETK